MNSTDILQQNQPLWGEWSLGDIIGSGAQSQVYLATGLSGEQCALKVISLGDDAEQAEAVREQIALTDRMGQYEGFVPCLRTGEFGGDSCRVAAILMPLLTPLSDILMERETETPVGDVLDIACDLCGALVRCRENGIIHRDIKPANVFADGKGNYCLGDLGVARNLEHTMLATRKGTPAYMSPEIASGKPCSYSSDVYSLGVMLYQLLNGGRLPLLGSEARYTEIEEAVTRRLNGEPLPLPENAGNRLGQLVCEMCSPEPKDRPSAQQCLDEIGQLSAIIEQGGELPPPRKRLAGKRLTLAAVCAAVLLVLAVVMISVGASGEYPQASSPAINAFSSGGAAGDDQWLYLGAGATGSSAYRVNRNTGKTEIIYDGSITHLNLCGDRLFFTANHTIERAEKLEDGSVVVYMREGVRSMTADGADEQLLCQCNADSIVEYDGWIYHYDAELDNDADRTTAFTRVMRVRNDGSAEEMLYELPDIYVTGMYPYRDRICLACSDYSNADEVTFSVQSAEIDGSDMFTVVDGYARCFDFMNDEILYTAGRLAGSALMRKKLDGSAPAQIVNGIEVVLFCTYKDCMILCTSPNYTGSSDENYGILLCNADGVPIRKLLDEYAAAIELAGDVLIVETHDRTLLALNIETGEAEPLEDFWFELY